jgi:hypothetical protein
MTRQILEGSLKVFLGQPLDVTLPTCRIQRLIALGEHLHGAGRILANVAQQRERVTRRDTVLAPPCIQRGLAVGQQACKECLDDPGRMLPLGKGHRERQRHSV